MLLLLLLLLVLLLLLLLVLLLLSVDAMGEGVGERLLIDVFVGGVEVLGEREEGSGVSETGVRGALLGVEVVGED